MKKFVVLSLLVLVIFSCGNQKTKKQNANEANQEVVVLTVDDLYQQAADLTDKEVTVKGTVMHVCEHGGQRCFIMGSNEDINIRIEAGEKIGAFSVESMGSDLEIVGVLREVKSDADAHNPGEHDKKEIEGEEAEEGEKHEGDHEQNNETEKAHKIIAESQDASEVVYFIEGIKSKDL